jgi:arylsulfatase A-like enzyme
MTTSLRARRIAVLVAATLAGSCGPQGSVGPPAVVLVVLDAAGAKHFGAYGNPRPSSPRVDQLAREGTVFERAHAQASWTLPSTASLLTGRYPPREHQSMMVVNGETLPGRLRAAGIPTAAFSENPLVTVELGFRAGFDVFREYFPKRLLDENPRGYPRVASETTVGDAIEWLEGHRGGPFFLYVHLLPPHCPYRAPAPYGGRFDTDYTGAVQGLPDTLMRINEGQLAITPRDLEHLRRQYQENLAFGDHEVGRLLDTLDALGLRDRTLVVVTADHGEGFGEHGLLLHTTTLYEELIHVPLIVRFPRGTGPLPSRWRGVVELRDVTATIARTFGLPGPAGLLGALRGTGGRQAVARSWTAEGDRALGALITDRYKLVVDRRSRRLELYDLAGDPGETTDLAGTERAVAVRLVRELRRGEGVSMGRRGRPLDDETIRRLRALGYVDPD